tara:strand:- start:505 stop:720 length:216 start_codon:yes stop_codon:yes gene_type:complete
MTDPNKKYNDSIRKVAKKKFPIFHNKDKSESADRAASINFSRLRSKKNYLNKNLKTKPKPGILDKIKSLIQ